MVPKAKAQMYLVPSTTNAAEPLTRNRMRALGTTNAAEPLTRNRMRALGDVSGDMRHVTQLRISLARFGKHSMLLYIHELHACMHVARML
jgi:hypothetical protein